MIVTSRIGRRYAGRGGSAGFGTHGVLWFGGLRELGTAFGTAGLPTGKRVRYLPRKYHATHIDVNSQNVKAHDLVCSQKMNVLLKRRIVPLQR